MSEPVVVNTGPVVALSCCGCLSLLTSLHSPAIIPEEVSLEVQRLASRQDFAHLASGIPGLELRKGTRPPGPILSAWLDPGEAAVIELATELGIGLVLIDERRGRLAARRAGLRVSGSVGVLLRAKTLGLLPLIGPKLDDMRRAGVWISRELQSRALAQAGEVPKSP